MKEVRPIFYTRSFSCGNSDAGEWESAYQTLQLGVCTIG